jgi:Lon protease-like protein
MGDEQPNDKADEPFRRTVAQLLECSVCLSLLCEPISISCGHTFCRVCLVKSLRRHKKQCPSCREICHISPENAQENIILKSLALQVDPAVYQQRAAESAVEKANWAAVYPVFLYNQAMLPCNKLSLHLFEPRYRLMMTRIVNTSRAFAYLSIAYEVAVGDIALVAELKETEFLVDGRCILEATLCKRSRVVEHYVEEGTQGLHYCRLERIHDDPVPEAQQETLRALKQHAVTLSETLLSNARARREAEEEFGPMPALNVEQFSWWFASISPLSRHERMVALHSRDTLDRLQSCVQCVEAFLAQRRSRGSFPIASALGATIASALSNFLGSNGNNTNSNGDTADGEQNSATASPVPTAVPLRVRVVDLNADLPPLVDDDGDELEGTEDTSDGGEEDHNAEDYSDAELYEEEDTEAAEDRQLPPLVDDEGDEDRQMPPLVDYEGEGLEMAGDTCCGGQEEYSSAHSDNGGGDATDETEWEDI